MVGAKGPRTWGRGASMDSLDLGPGRATNGEGNERRIDDRERKSGKGGMLGL